jgi:hypothetical protein
MIFVPHRKHVKTSAPFYGDSFHFCVNDIRASHETLIDSTDCYEDSFNFLYVNDVRTSQITHVYTSTNSYEDTFIFSDVVAYTNVIISSTRGEVKYFHKGASIVTALYQHGDAHAVSCSDNQT